MNNKVLGKGLRALIPDNATLPHKDQQESEKTVVQNINVEKIEPNKFQPRKIFEDNSLLDMAQSIKQSGVLQPILITKIENSDKYELIAGERRLRATKIAGFSRIPAIIKNIGQEEKLAVTLIENIQRDNLNVVEEAEAYNRLINEFSYTHEEISRKVGKSRAAVTNLLRLLRLPEEIKNGIIQKKVSMGHCRALLGIDSEKEQLKTFRKIIKKDMSVREVEKIVKKLSENSQKSDSVKVGDNFEIRKLENELSEYLSTKVEIRNSKGNKGKIMISYYNLDDFDRVYEKITKKREQ